MVTDATSEIALPFNTVCTIFPEVEKVTPAEEMIVPVIIPPPAALMVAELPTYQYTFLAWAWFINTTLRAPAGPAIPTVRAAAV